MELEIKILFVVSYVLSIVCLNWFFKIAYSSNGRWNNLDKTIGDDFIKYIPVINTMAFIIFMLCSGPYKKANKNK